MRAHEARVLAGGVCAEELMERVGLRMAMELRRRFPQPGTLVGFIGKGNNGGDALVVMRHLAAAGWALALRCAVPDNELGVLPRRMLRQLGPRPPERFSLASLPRPLVLLDGLLGVGACGGLREPLVGLAVEMNRLRETAGAQTVALDIPSGVDGDTGAVAGVAVCADLTLTVGLVKTGLLAEAAVNHVGRVVLIEVEELPVALGDADRRLVCPAELPGLLGPRPHEFHKGQAGRLVVLAGSPGMEGAAALAATGALRGGAGLVTLAFGGGDTALLARGLPPEVMVMNDIRAEAVLATRPDALAIGPGLTHQPQAAHEVLRILELAKVPMVLDAEALNVIARQPRAGLLGPRMVLTPHAGELQRLFPESAALAREEALRRFTSQHPCVLLFKGARTLVGQYGQPLWYNATGTPGMACGGQGDLLTGVIAALLAQKIEPCHAACLGAWLCGRAAEHAQRASDSQESLTPTTTSHWLGAAFADWRRGG